ncbi:MAG: DUF58 domain-containing protein [Planctomycetota bacterium]
MSSHPKRPEWATWFDPQTLRDLDGLRFGPWFRIGDATRVGDITARRGGRSTDFDQYRPYVQGDDPRRVDWKAYARSDKYYVRETEDQRALQIQILIDDSDSMRFVDPGLDIEHSKWKEAATIAATIGWAAIQGGHRVGMSPLYQSSGFGPPAAGESHLLNLAGMLSKLQTHGEGSLAKQIEDALGIQKPTPGILLIISDFLDEIASLERTVRYIAATGNQFVLIHCLAPTERDLAYSGTIDFVPIESGQRVRTDCESIRSEYRRAVQQFSDDLQSITTANGGRLVQHTVGDPIAPTVGNLLNAD